MKEKLEKQLEFDFMEEEHKAKRKKERKEAIIGTFILGSIGLGSYVWVMYGCEFMSKLSYNFFYNLRK